MSRRGTTPNPLPLGSSFSPFSQISSQSSNGHPLAQPKGKATPSTRPSTLSRVASGSGAGGGPTVEEWESKAPLDKFQTRCIAAVKKGSEFIRIPEKFVNPTDRDSPSRPSTPVPRNKLIPSSATPGTPASGISRPGTPSRLGPTNHRLHPKQPLHTPQAFYDWHALISRSVTHAQESHFRAHLDSVSSHIATCDFLISQIESVEKEIDSMYAEWQGVEEGGRSLKESSEGLLEERDALLRVEGKLGERLEYFKELEYATRMLNAPVLEGSKGKGGRPLVLEAEFLDMVERVVVCIQWLELHRPYREAEMYFVGSLRAVQADVGRRLSDKSVSSSTQTTHHLLYTRFRALISPPTMSTTASSPSVSTPTSLRPLLYELESRARAYPSELGALLGECHAAYLAARKALVGPVVREEVGGLVRGIDLASGGASGDIVELTRAGCSYLKQVCTDEFDIFKEFFTSGEEELYQYLETLCDYLYDDLRPRILHEPRLTALCEVCTVLQALMVLDVDVGDDGDSESPADPVDEDLGELELDLNLDLALRSGSRHNFSRSAGDKKSGTRLHISHLLQMILQDAQTRLFFKAQAVVQSDIRHYVARDGDLTFPSKLLIAAGLLGGPSLNVNEKESFSQLWSRQFPDSEGVSLDNQDTWYPTLRKTVWVLEQLHDYVNHAIFEDIAEEALVLCHASLVAASEAMLSSSSSVSSTNTQSANPTPDGVAGSSSSSESEILALTLTTPLDGHLFLVRHLLVLREVPAKFGLGNQNMDGALTTSTTINGRSGWASLTGTDSRKNVAGTNSVTDTLSSLLGGTPAASLLASFGMMAPELGAAGSTGNTDGKRTIDNAKQTINQSLRLSCESVITACANEVCEPVRRWVERVGAFSAAAASAASRGASLPLSTSASLAASSSNQSLPTNEKAQEIPDWATPASARSTDVAFRQACEEKLGVMARKIRIYLGGKAGGAEKPMPDSNDRRRNTDSISPTNASARTLCSVLIHHIQERIGEEYTWFRDVLWGLSSESVTGASASSLYSQEQLDELRELRSNVLDNGALKIFLERMLQSP